MAKKLYVGNLSYATNEDTLRNLFAQFGDVASANIVTDKYSGESKGFGFVEMNTAQEAEAAMNALNGQEVDGRRLRVDIAQDRQRGGGGGERRESRGGDRHSDYRY